MARFHPCPASPEIWFDGDFHRKNAVVGKKKRQARSAELLGSHQKCWLWGRHAVMETLRAGRWQPLEVHLDPSLCSDDLQRELIPLLRQRGIPLTDSHAQDLTRLCGSKEHQGLMAKMPAYPYANAQEVLANLPQNAFVLVLTGIQDPFNFGSILRSADLFDVDAVIVPDRAQSTVSSHVVRSSVGAVNYLSLVETPDLAEICRQLRTAGLTLLAATEQGELAPDAADLCRGTALLIGNEGTGIPGELLNLCDARIRIPQGGHVGSLNAAVAAGVLCYEVRRQRSRSA
jgi:23S rRNA (guanosine2251-2'-O)-methyltransferase